MRTLYGLEVVQNPHAVTLVPNKEHRINPKRRASYHARIQKKWNKRHGLKTVPGIFRTGDRFIIPPELYVKTVSGGGSY